MSFSAEWLRLREPADAAARNPELLARLVEWAAGRRLSVVDLGCGSGAMHRALSPKLPALNWTLVDADPDLLALAQATGAVVRRADLSGEFDRLTAEAGLVTASALFDLASADWIDGFVAAAPPGAAIYATLSYDGRETWSPLPRHEAKALDAFHAHQRRPKGLGAGPALGPDAAERLAARLEETGRRVFRARSPWRLGIGHRRLIRELAEGAAEAVADTGALPRNAIEEWRTDRCDARRVEIGHLDVLALP